MIVRLETIFVMENKLFPRINNVIKTYKILKHFKVCVLFKEKNRQYFRDINVKGRNKISP